MNSRVMTIGVGFFMVTPLMPQDARFAQHRFGDRQTSTWEAHNMQIAPFSIEDIM